jgi:hypothetical protein
MGRRASVFICPEDKEFLTDWARELNERTRKPVSAAHIMAIFVSDLRSLRSQGRLFPLLTEIEARAVRLATQEYDEDVRVIGIHARELRASQALLDQRKSEIAAKRIKLRRAA